MSNSSGQKNPNNLWWNAFLLSLGAFIGLCLVKFGNPVVLEHAIEAPRDLDELRYQSWPNWWAYFFFVPVLLLGIKVSKWSLPQFPLLFIVPIVWLCWQFVSSTRTVNPALTSVTLRHFIVCVACYYLGWLALAPIKDKKLLWPGLLLGYVWVLRVGFEQYFGGLEAARRHFEMYVLPTLTAPPVELMRKMTTGRIFSTLFYPNTLAAVILLLAPICSVAVWRFGHKLSEFARFAIIIALCIPSFACLYWSGSRSGMVLLVLLAFFAVAWAPLKRKQKLVMVVAVSGLMLISFLCSGQSGSGRGSSSMMARLDYWRAAAEIAATSPMLGTGPGTFSVPYAAIKLPSAEMARLVHNDFLEQASDSGIIGFLAYFTWICGGLGVLYRYLSGRFAMTYRLMFLGIAAVFIQSVVEFNLYIPAVAWPTFLFFGALLNASANEMDSQSRSR